MLKVTKKTVGLTVEITDTLVYKDPVTIDVPPSVSLPAALNEYCIAQYNEAQEYMKRFQLARRAMEELGLEIRSSGDDA